MSGRCVSDVRHLHGRRRRGCPRSCRRGSRRNDILATVDVQVDGPRPWDLRVHDERFFRRVLADGALGLGESYVEGWWDAAAVDEPFARLARLDLAGIPLPPSARWLLLRDRLLNPQRKAAAGRDVRRHHGLGNDLFTAMLGRIMAYSCAYWDRASSLDEAQDAKFDLVCRKLGLAAGERRCSTSAAGGGASCATRRAATVRGPRNDRTFFDVARRCLAADGLFLLHTIGTNGRSRGVDTWTKKYIVPGSSRPSIGEIGLAIEHRFVMEDWHSFGPDHDRTLMAWCANFEAAWEGLRPKYGDPFHRMWTYFLCRAAGSFRARRNQRWQIVVSEHGVPGGHRAVR